MNVSKAENWRLVVIVIVGIVALLALTNGFALYQERKAHAEVQLVVDNAMKSIELVHRMRADMYREQRLVDAHILAADVATMAQAEAKISELETDFTDAASAYQPLVGFAGEAAAWRRLKEDVAAIREPLARTLALSRENRDDEARAALFGVEGRLAAIGIDVDELVRINDSAAEKSAARIKRLQHFSIAVSMSLQFVAALLIVGIGFGAVVWCAPARTMSTATRWRSRRATGSSTPLPGGWPRFARPLEHHQHVDVCARQTLAGRATTGAILQRGVARMEAVIEDLLALSRIGEGAARGGIGDPRWWRRSARRFCRAPWAEAVTLQLAVEPAKVQCAEGLFARPCPTSPTTQ